MRRGFVEDAKGRLHYAEAGSGDPVLLLHQTPRSWTEFRPVLPLLGRCYRAIAMDTVGFGDSDSAGEDSIDCYADGVVRLLDGLGLSQVSLVGHHTGGIIGVEVAAAHPERVRGLVLSCTPLVDALGRTDRPDVDAAPVQMDGSHLTELWQVRQPYYPEDRPDLLEAFIIDALKAGHRRVTGHRAVARYVMEDRLPLVKCPVLLVGAPGDVAFRDLPRWEETLPDATVEVINGGMVPLPEHMPNEFVSTVTAFLEALP